MKRFFILLAVVFSSSMAVKAQDTIVQSDMRLMDNYFVPMWLDSFYYIDYFGVYTVNLQCLAENYPWIGQRAFRMYTEDTLTVYGLAGGFSTFYRLDPGYYERHPEAIGDSSCTNSRIYMRLYEAGPYELQHIGEELMVHLDQTPVSYLLDLDVQTMQAPWEHIALVPMYERYFKDPVTVADSFYVGTRFRDTYTGGADVMTLSISGYDAIIISYCYYRLPENVWSYHTGQYFIPLLFPIIAPPDTTNVTDTTNITDTTHVDDTTARISAPDLVYRYTAVQPNPASAKARVTSSFGVGKIEAYDEKGNLVYSTEASGHATTIDVSTWKKGIYLLRITTGAGTTTKKLLVE